MRSLKSWALALTAYLFVLDRAMAIPPLTTVQDTLYKADGARFNGVAYIEWKSFQASDASAIASSSVVVPIVDGSLRVRLVPTSNASAGAHYFVRYHADGRVVFTEAWNVPPSTTAVTVANVRIANGASTGGGVTPPSNLTIPDITGLSDELAARPVKGFVYTNDRILKTGPTGALEAVQGNLADCIRVDGSTGPCGSGSGTGAPGFVDHEVPTGSVNGSNAVFTLAQPPSPATSLALYRNGILQKPGIDFSVTGNTVTFAALSIPQTSDLLMASYRLPSESTPSGLAAGALTGSFPAPQIAEGVISNFNISAAAGIVESKLALNFPTHTNANDPSAGEKAALSGTAGAPSATNKFVTDIDGRLTNARPPVSHALLSNEHGDTAAGTVQRGDLIVGMNLGTAKWGRLPLGSANRCLVSNGADAIWNTCLFTGFQNGAIPFTGGDGTLAESPLHFVWDNANRRLSVGSNWSPSTLTVYDGASGAGATTLTVRAALGQGANPLQTWLDPAGVEQARMEASGEFVTSSVRAASNNTRAAWRESGTTNDPASKLDGDRWYNTTVKAQRTFESGQTHSAPQVICASTGGNTAATSLTQLGTCTIPPGLLQPGDRVAIRATWKRGGAVPVTVRWRWATAVAADFVLPANATLIETSGEAALSNSGAIISSHYLLQDRSSDSSLMESADPFSTGLTLAFEAFNAAPGANIALIQFSLIRYPAQSNP
ncbi:MAG: hypothetical protein FJW30_06340 [Acidobacteria bacterium]|nr:hypothetical protein [Acidobacteriota bacterium]